MIRKITLLFLACLGMHSLSLAQKCGFDAIHQLKMATDPEYATAVNQFNTGMANWLASNQNAPELVTTYNGNKAWEIPVVVHIIDTGTTPQGSRYNPTNTDITNLINYLSQAFTASYSGHLLEANGGTRIPIVFKLAARTPSSSAGNCSASATNGIIRIDAGSNSAYVSDGVSFSGPGISDNALKALSYWPNTEYYNIWIVNKIDGANGYPGSPSPYTAGYAVFAPNGPSLTDGTVMLASQVDVGNSVITHELGHAFDLLHVFQGDAGGSVCPPNGNCNNDNDEVCDTQPIKRSPFNCPADNTNTCNPPTNAYNNTQRNFMDYSNCKDRFTPGQRVRVWNALMSLTAPTVRSSLISSLGATPLGTPVAAAVCNPSGTGASNLGPRAVTIIKDGGSNPDTFIMNAMSSSVTNDGGAHYLDRTCQHRAELIAGQTYSFRVTVGFATEIVRAFIDYNNDGDFGDPGETIYVPANGPGTRPAIPFTVPATGATYCVPIRLRVVTNTGSIPTACQTGLAGQAEDYEVVIRGGGASTPTPGLVTIPPPLSGNPSCAGSGNTVIATHSNTITPVWYGWYRKSTNGVITPGPSGVDTFWSTNAWADLDTVWVRVAYPGICGIDTTSDSIVMYRPLTIAPAVTIGITGGTNPTCIDDTVTLSVVGNVNPGSNPSYQWRRNGVNIGTNGPNPTYKVINNISGSNYDVIMTSNAGTPCAIPSTATSTPLQITNTTKQLIANIALTTGTNPGCPGQLLTFTASADPNGAKLGTSPTFQWRVNSVNVPGANGITFTSVRNNNDVVTCLVTSSSPCALPASDISDPITVTHQPITADISISQVSGGNPACSGHPVIFSATPSNAGVNPQFQWLINNVPVTGANSPVFNTTTLANGDQVSCILIATDPCVANTLDTSNVISMLVTQSLVPSVTIAITAGINPGCLDSFIEFTATPNNTGASPDYKWLINGNEIPWNNPVFSGTTFQNGDAISCRVITTDGQCYLPDSAESTPIVLTRSPTPDPPIISLIGNQLVTNKAGSFIWFGPGGQLTGGENGTYHPGELGAYYCVTNNNGCWSKPSNTLIITLLDISTLDMANMKVYPNPTTGQLVVDWGYNSDMNIDVYNPVGQKLLQKEIANESRKTIDLSELANGVYFVVITDSNGKSGTVRVTVNR